MTGPVLAPRDLADLVALEIQQRLPEVTVAVVDHCEDHQRTTLMAGIQLAVVFDATDQATTIEAMPSLTGQRVSRELERGLREALRVIWPEYQRHEQRQLGQRLVQAFKRNEDMAGIVDQLLGGTLDVEL